MNIFYFNRFCFLAIFLTNFTFSVERVHEDIMNLPELIDVRLVLTTIKDIQRELEDDLNEFQSNFESDTLVEVVLICIEMYEKIIEATVTHYLMINVVGQQNLHDAIIRIVVFHIIKIINLLYRKLLQFFFNHEVTWKEKIVHCTWILGTILIIKIGIEKLPKNINPVDVMANLNDNKEEKSFWPKAKSDFLGDSLTKKL